MRAANLQLAFCMASGLSLSLTLPASSEAAPTWYLLQLSNQHRMFVKVFETTQDAYLGQYQGTRLELPRDQVLSAIEVAKLDDSKQEHGLTGAQKCRALDAIEALASMDPPTRIRAYRVIQDYFPGCRPFVHGALRHREARVRKLAVKVLGENGEARHDLAPATTLLRDPEGTVRLAAVMAIRELGPDTALEPTLAHIRWEPEINIRRMSIKNLRRWKDSRAVPTLKQLLRSEEDRNVRVSIARALDAITGLGLGESPRAWLQHLDREDDDS